MINKIQFLDNSTELGRKYISQCSHSPGAFILILEEMKIKKIKNIVLEDTFHSYLLDCNVKRRTKINAKNVKFNLYILNTLLENSHND